METIDQNLWNITELGLWRKFIKTSNKQHNFIPQGTRKKEQMKPKVNKRKVITKIREEINEIETKKSIEKINETKSWFLKKIKQNRQRFSQTHQKERERPQIHERRRYYNQYHTNTKDCKRLLCKIICDKLKNLEEMDKFLETYNLPRLNKEETENLNYQEED